MAQPRHLEAARLGAAAWKEWRAEHPTVRPDLSGADLAGVDLSGADLAGADLRGACLCKALLTGASLAGRDGKRNVTLVPAELPDFDLGAMSVTWADLSGADLRDASLAEADVSGANLRGADLTAAHASGANFTWANLERLTGPRADLSRATLYESYLMQAQLDHALLIGADLQGAKVERTDLSGADLSRAKLCRASLVDANVAEAVLDGAFVHGVAAWNVRGVPARQRNLVITRSFPPYDEPQLVVDDLQVAQFIYLLLTNPRIRDVIDTITSKAVLILGRFTPARKAILDALRDALRDRGYVPVLFDFTPSVARDLTETVVVIAGLAKFVIADLTEAKSIPQELSAIVPVFTLLPVQPIVEEGVRIYAMFEHWKKYPWVLEPVSYADAHDLVARLDAVIGPAERRRSGEDEETRLKNELQRQKNELQRQRNDLQRQRNDLQRQQNELQSWAADLQRQQNELPPATRPTATC